MRAGYIYSVGASARGREIGVPSGRGLRGPISAGDIPYYARPDCRTVPAHRTPHNNTTLTCPARTVVLPVAIAIVSSDDNGASD